MSNRVDELYKQICECAKEEFLTNGFEKASVRNIAKKANTSTNAIYVRFGDKEGLYRTLLQPVTEGFLDILRDMHSKNQRYTTVSTTNMLDYIFDNHSIFEIVIKSGQDDIYQEFLHSIVEVDIVGTLDLIDETGSDAITTGRLTPDLAHVLSASYYTGIFEIIVHNIPKEEAKLTVVQLGKFYKNGWNTIL